MPEGSNDIRPVDLGRYARTLELGIGQAAALCGVSIRQLSYWTDKGLVQPKGGAGNRTYDYAAIERVCLIKQALGLGYTLENAAIEAEAFLERRAAEEDSLDVEGLQRLILAQADRAEAVSKGIRSQLRAGRAVGGSIGQAQTRFTMTGGFEKLVAYFEANPYTVATVQQVALRVGRTVEDVQPEIDLLTERRFLQRIAYPSADVYRHLPRKRMQSVITRSATPIPPATSVASPAAPRIRPAQAEPPLLVLKNKERKLFLRTIIILKNIKKEDGACAPSSR